jgi:site-specific DNA-cytosine methylase
MRLLELFSGTGSVRKAVGNQFEEIISIDILQKFEPTECADILKWDYKKYPPRYFDAIWASPPCTEYSKLKYISGAARNLVLADSIVQRTLEIIEYFNPERWFIENPQTGL